MHFEGIDLHFLITLVLKNETPMKRILDTLVLLMFIIVCGCSQKNQKELAPDELYTLFNDPPTEARPFVRWWWNGDCVEVDELERELDVMKAAGIGGVLAV